MIEGLPPTLGMIATQNPGLEYATAPSPTQTGRPVTLGVADHLMAFVKNGKRRRVIAAFLDYFYSPPVYANFVKSEGFIPITRSGAAALADTPVTRAFGGTLPYAKFYPSSNPKWVTVQAAIQQNIGTVAQGADPQTVLARIQRVADEGN
jgi:multiple sugar transport system substrate-binding protein